ncbi:MAG: DNA cytosine methyltransferase, partial [Lentisphaeria bacterium]|nr:DNA cytosine methyltransferase [Lentisphaeria bacterium]
MRLSWIKQYNQLNKEGVIPNEGDFTKIGKKYAGEIDLLVGGTPCQDLSVAGKRAGFDGERSSLAIDFVRLAYES